MPPETKGYRRELLAERLRMLEARGSCTEYERRSARYYGLTAGWTNAAILEQPTGWRDL